MADKQRVSRFGRSGMPEMDDEMVHTISERYILLYETITGNQFQRTDPNTIQDRVEGVVTELIRG